MVPTRKSRALLALVLIAAGCLAATPVQALSYYISYMDDPSKEGQIRAAMDEAIAVYNATTNINVNIQVKHINGVPTAQSNYNGEIAFGGSISTQVAIHEIAHYLGSGTTTEWENQFGGDNVWDGGALRHFVKNFDGPGGEIYRSGVHYYPYGFNYGNEDTAEARLREPRLIQAMRFDMGGQDSDGDGISDEWERYKIGDLSHANASDIDGDGLTTFDEWWTEGDPMKPSPIRNGRVYQIRAKHSGKLIEVDSANAGANVRQNAATGSNLQKWTAVGVGGGYWKFVNLGSGKVMETLNQSTAASADIIAWNDTGNPNQHWRAVPDGTIYFKLFNKNASNMVVDVDGGTGATGNAVNISQYYDVVGGTNQDWEFEDVTPNDPGVALMAEYKLDGNARDNSCRLYHGTASGGITYGTGRVDGQCATFNGTTGSIQIPASVDGNFTLACWVKTSATAGAGQWYNGMGLVDAEVPGVAADFGLAMVGNKAAFGIGKTDKTIFSTSAINDNVWHHIAATWDVNTGAMKLYVDGALQTSDTGPTGYRTAPGSFRLGSIGGTVGFFNGGLDEVRIYNKVLNQTEVTRLATVANTMVANYPFEGNLQDISNHNNHGDPNESTYVAGRNGGSALQCNGTNSYAKIPASVVADFSIGFWVKTTATGGTPNWYNGKSIVDADVPGNAADWGIALVGSKAGFGVGNATDSLTIVSTTSINDGAWHHVAVTRTNSTGAMRLYVDGALQATGTASTTLRNAPHGIRIGSTLYGGTYLNGAIDDLKFFNYALPPIQVTALSESIPAPWSAADIGVPGSDGVSGRNANTDVYDVLAAGNISGLNDQFHFISTSATGNQSLVTRMTVGATNLDSTTNAGAKAGVMFRDSSATNAPFVGLMQLPGVGIRMVYRNSAVENAVVSGTGPATSAPFWLKLERIGNVFNAYYATTGPAPAAGDWTFVTSRTQALATSSLAGMALTSQNAQAATAAFSSPSLTAVAPGDVWRQMNFGATANTGNASDKADPDGDGIANLLERAYGLNPAIANPSSDQPLLAKDPSYLTLSYNRSLAATDLQIQGLWSGTLGSWSSSGVIDSVLSTTSTTERHQAKVPLANFPNGRGFMRLQVK